MKQEDGRIARIEHQLDSLHAWQVESAAMQAEALTEIKATNQHILQYTQVAAKNLENRLDKVEKDMSAWEAARRRHRHHLFWNLRLGNVVGNKH